MSLCLRVGFHVCSESGFTAPIDLFGSRRDQSTQRLGQPNRIEPFQSPILG